MNFMDKRFVIALLVFAEVISGASAEPMPPAPSFHLSYGVSDWHELVPEKAAEYKTYRLIILSNSAYTEDEKAAKIARKYSEIREIVSSSRTEAYSAISEVRGVGNSATNGGGGSKNEGAKCVGASKENMYTKPEWARGAYKSGDDLADVQVISSGIAVNPAEIVTADGAQICAIRLKQSGNGRKVSYSEATFRIRPEQIKTMVNAEILSLMYEISNTSI